MMMYVRSVLSLLQKRAEALHLLKQLEDVDSIDSQVALLLLRLSLCKKPSIRYCIFLRIFCVYHQYTKVSAYFKYPLVYFMNPRATIIHSAYS